MEAIEKPVVKLSKLKDAIGKRLIGHSPIDDTSNHALFAFEGGVFCEISAYGERSELIEDTASKYYDDFGLNGRYDQHWLLDVGAVTTEMIAAHERFKAANDEKWKKSREASEYATFLKLKAKYEPEGTQ